MSCQMGFMYKMKSTDSFFNVQSKCANAVYLSMCEWSMSMLMVLHFQSYSETFINCIFFQYHTVPNFSFYFFYIRRMKLKGKMGTAI
jgi:hypothetical protein